MSPARVPSEAFSTSKLGESVSLTLPSQAMAELAASTWNLVIVNVALVDPKGPLFAILKELAQSELVVPQDHRANLAASA